jgi:hypothetical protein
VQFSFEKRPVVQHTLGPVIFTHHLLLVLAFRESLLNCVELLLEFIDVFLFAGFKLFHNFFLRTQLTGSTLFFSGCFIQHVLELLVLLSDHF